MSVSDGSPVNAAVTNAAFLSRTNDSDTTGKVGLKNTDPESGSDVNNAQRLLNELADVQGNTGEGDATSKDYSSNNVVANGDDRKVAIGKLDAEFDAATGHSHDGTDSAPIDSSNLTGHNPFTAEYQAKELTAASGLTFDVSTDFSGDTPGGDATTEGVLTTAPNNYVSIVDTDTQQEIEDVTGKRVFGRITESSSTWTLSFFVNDAGVETAHNLSSTDITIFYREVFGPANPKPTITADVAGFDSLNATADIADASATQAGKVSTGAQSFAGQKTFVSGADVNGDQVVTENATQTVDAKTITNASIETPTRSDVKQDTRANLDTYALTATNGQFVFATDTKEMLQIVDNALVPVGGGAGGSLDFFYNEDFNAIDLADILVTGTWTKALETVAPISGDQSIKLTQASGSLGAYATVASIDLEENTKDNTIAFQTRYKYDGSDVDLEFRVYDVTNAQYIGSVPLKATSSVKTAQIICNTRATTNQLEWRFVVVNENIGAILDFDNVEGRLNPLSINNQRDAEYAHYQGYAAVPSTNSFALQFTNQIQDNSGELIEIVNDSTNGLIVTAKKDCYVTVSFTAQHSSGQFFGVTKNADLTTFISGVPVEQVKALQVTVSGNVATATTESVFLNAGDYLAPHTDATGAIAGNTRWAARISAVNSYESVIFENQSSAFDWTDYTPTITGTSGLTIERAQWRRSGDSIEIQAQVVTGTQSATEFQFSLPNDFVVKSGLSNQFVGYIESSSPANDANYILLATSGDNFLNYGFRNASVNNAFTPQNTNFAFNNGATLSINALVPIEGLSASDILYSVPVTNLVENVYSATIDVNGGTGAVTVISQSSAFIASATRFQAGVFDINFPVGFFGQTPSASAISVQTSFSNFCRLDSVTATSMRVVIQNSGGGGIDLPFHIRVQRQGADYRAPKGYFLGNLSQPSAYIQDRKAASVQQGGTSVSGGWFTRTLNTLDDKYGVTAGLASNQVTLTAGTYRLRGHSVSYQSRTYISRWQNITDSTTAVLGMGVFGFNGDSISLSAPISGEFTITSTKVFELQYRVNTGKSADGLGVIENLGVDGIYSDLELTKIR